MIITIGGNIGCGKTTVINSLKSTYENVFEEPIDKWGSWLDFFYVDMKKYAFAFQMKVLLEFLNLSVQSSTGIHITERCPLDSFHVFTQVLFNQNILHFMEYNLFQDYVDNVAWKPQVYIYLQCSPDTCLERISLRSRSCETYLDIDYITQLHNAYDTFVKQLSTHKNVHIINSELSKEEILQQVNSIIEMYTN